MTTPPVKPAKKELKKAMPTKPDRDAKVPATKGPIAKSTPSPAPKKGPAAAPSVGHVFAAAPVAVPPPGPPPAIAAGPAVQAAPPVDMQQQYGRLDGRALAKAILGAFASQIAQPGVK